MLFRSVMTDEGVIHADETVVAAGAVVRGEFPDHVVLGGVPARVLRHLGRDGEWADGPPMT